MDQLQTTYLEMFIYIDGRLHYRHKGRVSQIGYETQRGEFVTICGIDVPKSEIVWQYHFGRLKTHEKIMFKDRDVNNIRVENLYVSKMCSKSKNDDVVISVEDGKYPSGK